MTEHVRTHQSGHVLELCLNRAEKKNAITNDMYGALADALLAAERDDKIRVVLLTAEGADFTAGNDLSDFMAIASGALDPRERHVTRFLKSLATAQAPIVAAVQGQAIGIGVTMLLHCDIVFVTPDARLSTPFVHLGLVPEAASSLLLPARIGYARAFAMFAMGHAVLGEEAVRIGLASAVAPAGSLRAVALEAARDLSTRPPGAVRAAKRLMRDSALLSEIMDQESAIFSERLQSTEAREAFQAFLEKRSPRF